MLFNYGLISKEDLRPDFGGSDDMPECDSDLENEIHKAKEERDERVENCLIRIITGFLYITTCFLCITKCFLYITTCFL